MLLEKSFFSFVDFGVLICDDDSDDDDGKGSLLKKKKKCQDFHGGPVVKTSLSNAGTEGSTPGQRAKLPHDLQPKNQNVKGNILTNSIKTLKIVHIKKKKSFIEHIFDTIFGIIFSYLVYHIFTIYGCCLLSIAAVSISQYNVILVLILIKLLC